MLTCCLVILATFFVKGVDTIRLATMLVSTTYLKYPNIPKFENKASVKLYYDDYVNELLCQS